MNKYVKRYFKIQTLAWSFIIAIIFNIAALIVGCLIFNSLLGVILLAITLPLTVVFYEAYTDWYFKDK